MKISKVTRKDIIDAISLEKISWWGRMEETAFLSRLYDLQKLPSTDSRYSNAENDIWQHRVNNNDWPDNWIFEDERFELNHGDDEIFLNFLCLTIHPEVRSDWNESERICRLYNKFLINDNFELVEEERISGKPVFISKFIGALATPGLISVKKTIPINDDYIHKQIERMEKAVYNDPALAIGTSKEFIETICKTILDIRKIYCKSDLNLIKLVQKTTEELALTRDDIPEQAKAAETIKRLLSSLAAIAQGVSELRNQYGTGHGKSANSKGLSSRHAKLAVGAASTLAVFLFETHESRLNPADDN